MALCKDPALTYLNDRGYNVVRAPRAGILPLDVLGRDAKSLERLGRLQQIWTSDVEPPEILGPRPAVHIEGKSTSKLKLSIGLKLLADVLSAMGAAAPSIGFAYERARTIEFRFSGVNALSVDPFTVGSWLANGDLAAGNPFVERYFFDDGAEAYVLTEVLTATTVSAVARDSSGGAVEVDVSAVRRALSGSVGVESGEESEAALSYKSAEPLTFGFKAYEIAYDGDWKVRGVDPSGAMAFDEPGAEPETALLSTGRVSLR